MNASFLSVGSVAKRKSARVHWTCFAAITSLFFVGAPYDADAQTVWDWRNDYGSGNTNWGATHRWFSDGLQTLTGSDQNIQLVIGGSQDATQWNEVTGAGVRGVTFSSGSSSRTVGGNLLKIGISGTGKIENASGNTQTLNLTLSNSTVNGLEINPVSGLLNLSNIHLGTNFVDMYGNQTVHYRGNVSGSAPMTWKTNSGVVTAIFSASNSLTSSFNIERGYMILSNASASVGTGLINIGAADNAWLAELQLGAGGAQTNNIANSIDIKSASGNAGVNRSIASLSSSGTNVVTGRVTNNNSGLSAKLFIASGGTLRFSNVVAGSGGFYMDSAGGGTLELSSSNTITGGFYIDAGTIKLSGTSANAGDGALHIGSADGATNASLFYSGTNGGITASNTLTVNSGTGNRTIVSENTTSVNTFLGSATLNTNLSLSNASGGEFRLGNTVSGTGGLIKQGAGTLTLSGTNTFSGVLTVAEGKLTISTINNASQDGVLGNSANAVVLGSNGKEGFLHYVGTENASSTKAFTAATSGTAGIEVSNAATTLTLSGAIGGSGAVTKGGAGTLLLSGTNSFSGALSIHDGTIKIASINNNGAVGVLGSNSHAVNLGKTNTSNTAALFYTGDTASTTKGLTLVSQTNAAGVVNVSSAAAALTVSGAVTGGGRLEKAGAGTLILSASNNYAGGTTLAAGVLQLNSIHAAGTGKITQTTNNSTLQINTTGTVANEMDLYNIRTMQTVTLSGNKTLHNATYTVDLGVTTTESGNLSGSGGVTKQGTGTLVLTGTNTYTGTVSVQAGVLDLNSTAPAAAAGATTNVVVATNAVLLISQSNQFNDSAPPVSLSGGTIQRGSGVSETFGALSLTANSFLNFGGVSESADLSFGTLNLGAFSISVSGFALNNQLKYAATSEANGLELLSKFSFDNAYTTGFSGSTFTITAIPEPSTYVAAAGLLAMFLWPVRRRLVKDVKSILGLRPTGRAAG